MAPAAHGHHQRHHNRQTATAVTNTQHRTTQSISSTRQHRASFTSLFLKNPLSLPTQTSLPPSSTTHSPQPTNHPRASPPSSHYPLTSPHLHNPPTHQAPETASPPLIHALSTIKPTNPHAMQTWLAILILATILAAGLWALVVSSLHHRGLVTGMTTQRRPKWQGISKSKSKSSRKSKSESESESESEREREREHQRGIEDRRRRWWIRLRNRIWIPAAAASSEYAVLRTQERDECTAVSSAHHVPSALQGASPVNPFLKPPGGGGWEGTACGSVEWAQRHRMFFGEGDGEARVLVRGSAVGELADEELDEELAFVEYEAREAQGERVVDESDIGGLGLGREGDMSWVDLGLAAVDEAVDRVAARIVRWTDDGGRDEELVLPLVKGKLD